MIVPAGAGAWLRRRGFGAVTELGVGEVAKAGTLTELGAGDVAQAGGDGAGAGDAEAGAVRAGSPRRAPPRRPARRGARLPGERRAHRLLCRRHRAFRGDVQPAATARRALLPVAGWGPTLGAGHMAPFDAARAAGLIEPRIAIPVHWGTLSPLGLGRHDRARLGDPPRLFAEHRRKYRSARRGANPRSRPGDESLGCAPHRPRQLSHPHARSGRQLDRQRQRGDSRRRGGRAGLQRAQSKGQGRGGPAVGRSGPSPLERPRAQPLPAAATRPRARATHSPPAPVARRQPSTEVAAAPSYASHDAVPPPAF